ncbi:TPA: hypothetical protein JG832_002481 [Enterobacter hormaechei subsp. xiangfangensis]|nr:hypothetical protein [Enterobacter hormaechei subsp. xiangfangensis]HAV1890616.1 hypothetical protein [Enterobacter hormaechei subsp. xiangfangensis]
MAANPKKGTETYHVLDFQNLNQKGLAGLVTAIKQAGTEIAEVIPAGPARKKDGVPVKQFSLVDMAGQNMTFTVTETGDISGVTLNGKAFPETHPTSLKDLATKIAKGFEKTEESFQASLARKVAKQARLDADKEAKKSNKKAVKTQAQRLTEATEKLTVAQNALTDLRSTVAQREQQQQANSAQLTQLNQQLNTEIALTGTLKQQIAQLQRGA